MSEPPTTLNEPSGGAEATISRMQNLRGRILGDYACVEFTLADLVVQCRAIPAYKELDLRFPSSMSARVRAAKAILQAPGPFESGAIAIPAMLDRLMQYEMSRHDLAHGLVQIYPTRDGTVLWLEILRWAQKSKVQRILKKRTITPAEFEAEAGEVLEVVGEVMSALGLLYIKNGLCWARGETEPMDAWPHRL